MGKLKLKPWKGYKFRLILCDEKGNYVCDDYNLLIETEAIARLLIKDYREKYMKERDDIR